MVQLRRMILRLTDPSPERKACRALLAAAKKGDREQYLALSANYLNLVQAYFGNSLREAPEIRMDRSGQIFTALWQHLRYAERLSDFEYMLASSLIDNAPEDGPVHSENPIVTRIRLLPPQVRFAFIAYEFERWSPRWVTLVMRCKPGMLHRMLSEARCELCGVGWDSLCREERDCLQAISRSFERSPNLRANQALSKRVADYPRVSEIKALWLELAPELVEARLCFIPDRDARETTLKGILAGISQKPMRRPALVDRVLNTVHFSRHARIKVS